MSISRKPELLIFIDESGNTGGNLWDPAQPIYVTAAIPFMPEQETLLAARIGELKTQCGVPSLTEPKAGSLITSPRNRIAILEFVQWIFKNSFKNIAWISITEKQFCAAARLVDEFLDPVYNGAIHVSNYPGIEHQEAAYLAYTLIPKNVLMQFYEAYLQEDRTNLLQARNSIADILRGKALGDGLLTFLLNVPDQVIDAMLSIDPELVQKKKTQASPNVGAFIALLGLIDGTFLYSNQRRSLIHDESAQFALIFKQWFNQRRAGPTRVIRIPHNNHFMISGTDTSKSVQFESSHDRPGLQAVDFLCSSIRWAFSEVILGNKKDTTGLAEYIARWIAKSILHGNGKLTHAMQSEHCMRRIGEVANLRATK